MRPTRLMREREKRRHSGSVRRSDRHPNTSAGKPHRNRPHSSAAVPSPDATHTQRLHIEYI